MENNLFQVLIQYMKNPTVSFLHGMFLFPLKMKV